MGEVADGRRVSGRRDENVLDLYQWWMHNLENVFFTSRVGAPFLKVLQYQVDSWRERSAYFQKYIEYIVLG